MAPVKRTLPIPIQGDNGPRHDGFIGETDPVVLARRQKQIDYGKNTESYQKYRAMVPNKLNRNEHGPWTPNKYDKFSRRSFDQQIKLWKLDIHAWHERPKTSGEKMEPVSAKTNNAVHSIECFPTPPPLDLCALISDEVHSLDTSTSTDTETDEYES